MCLLQQSLKRPGVTGRDVTILIPHTSPGKEQCIEEGVAPCILDICPTQQQQHLLILD